MTIHASKVPPTRPCENPSTANSPIYTVTSRSIRQGKTTNSSRAVFQTAELICLNVSTARTTESLSSHFTWERALQSSLQNDAARAGERELFTFLRQK